MDSLNPALFDSETEPADCVGFTIDPVTHVIRVWSVGFMQLAGVEAHFLRLSQAIRQLRGQGRDIRVVLDLRQSPAQSAEVVQRIAYWSSHIYIAGDRVATIAPPSLAKMQMRRMGEGMKPTAHSAYFLTAAEAEAWLSVTE